MEPSKSEAEKKEEKIESSNEKKEPEKSSPNKTEDSKSAEQETEKSKEEDKPAPGSSKDTSYANGLPCSTEQNGDVKENGENDGEDIGKEDEEDEVNNLQVLYDLVFSFIISY